MDSFDIAKTVSGKTMQLAERSRKLRSYGQPIPTEGSKLSARRHFYGTSMSAGSVIVFAHKHPDRVPQKPPSRLATRLLSFRVKVWSPSHLISGSYIAGQTVAQVLPSYQAVDSLEQRLDAARWREAIEVRSP